VRHRLAALALTFAFSAGGAAAQTPTELATSCRGQGGAAMPCAAAALASRALLGHAGLLAGLGSEVSGTATTLGTRVGGGPRFAFGARIAAAGLETPDPAGGAAVSTSNGTALHLGVAVGLFDGLRLMPTVGGFLSLDAFGQLAFVRLSETEGFTRDPRSLTLGLRVGVLREGFTMPGVSISASRRFVSDVQLGGPTDAMTVTVGPSVTSVRATVGKDLHAVEFLAGFGWDDYSGGAVLRVSDALLGSVNASGDVGGSRRMLFGSAARTFGILLTLSAEVGLAEGFDPATSYSGAFDPGHRTLFGGLSARLGM
jgi:hypothetical protein